VVVPVVSNVRRHNAQRKQSSMFNGKNAPNGIALTNTTRAESLAENVTAAGASSGGNEENRQR